MLPTFIVIGAGKAGTTSLWAYLRDHPEIFMSERKELDFFTTEHNWDQGLAWYEAHFEGADGARAVGEVSGNYANWPEYDGVPARMAGVVPNAQLAYVIRHPIERMVSAYLYLTSRGEETRPMAEAFRERPLYLNVSRYASQIEQFLEHYPRERLLVLTSEDLRDDRHATMRGVFTFLGVDPSAGSEALDHEYNRTGPKLYRPRTALRWARHVPGYDRLARQAPTGLRTAVRRLGKTPVVREPDQQLTDELRWEVENELREDTRRLRSYLGSDFHCWGLA